MRPKQVWFQSGQYCCSRQIRLCIWIRPAATLAARSGDAFAVQRLLGHVDLQMATRYVQDVSEQTDRVIEKSRKCVIGAANKAAIQRVEVPPCQLPDSGT